MSHVLSLVFPLFSIVFIGYLAGRIRALPVAGLSWLNFFVVYISLPALLYVLLSATPVEQFANGAFLLASTGGTLLVFILCFAIARLLRRASTEVATIQGFTGAYGNIGYMGPPLAIAAFGPEAGVPVALIFCLDNSLHFTLAPVLMAMGGRSKVRGWQMPISILKSIFLHPFILATIAGIAAAYWEFKAPMAALNLLDILANAAAPCALFAMGVTAALRPVRRIPVDLLFLVPIKLLVHPLLVYLLVSRVPDIPPVWLYSAVLLAALPSATNVFVIAQHYQVWEQRASSAVVISTLLSTVTVTLYIYLASNGIL